MQLNRSSDDILRPIRFGQLLFFSFIVSYGYPVKIAKRPLVLVANNQLMKKFNIKL